MNNQDYEQKNKKCWLQFCQEKGVNQELNISIFDAFDYIFDSAYALGKQEKDAEGEEMLTVPRKKVQYFYEKLRKVGENHAAFALQSLFGSKCLPDEVLINQFKFKVGDKVVYHPFLTT